MQCPCAPGIVALALEQLQLSGTPLPDALLESHTPYDPVLAIRLRRFRAAADASATLADPAPLLRAMLLSISVAEGENLHRYAECWRRSVKTALLTRALAQRSGLVGEEMAWFAGLTHNLADYASMRPQGALEDQSGLEAVSALWLSGLDADGWLEDAVRYHTLPLARTKTAQPLVRLLQLAYILASRPQATDSVDVRAALSTLGLEAEEGVALLTDADSQLDELALRFGLSDAQLGAQDSGSLRLARVYAQQAAQFAIHTYLRSADKLIPLQQALRASLRILFGIEHACLYVPQADGMLHVLPVFDPPIALSGLGVALEDSHSVLSRAFSGAAPQLFDTGEPGFAVVDAQIARILGVTAYMCQRVLIGDAQPALLICDQLQQNVGRLWEDFVGEWNEAHLRVDALVAPRLEDGGASISRERVRRAVHEIANPLTIMRNYVNLLSARPGTDTSVQRDLSIISEEIERVARIVRNIANSEDEASGPSMELTSVNSLVSELVRMTIGTLLAPNKISVQIDLNPEVQPMPLHKDQLKQVLFNLAKNAVEAMGQGGHLLFSTRLVSVQDVQWVEIEVADTGPGVPEHIRAHLFEAVASEKGGEHAGLGLAISRKLISRMGGIIDYESDARGTRFLIRLPTLYNSTLPKRNASVVLRQ